MKDTKTILDHMLAPLIQKYLERLQTRESLIAELIRKIESGHITVEDTTILQREAHQLAGSGATYGFPAISEAGFALEEAIESRRSAQDILPLAQALLQSCLAVQFLQSSSRQPVRKSTIADSLPVWNVGAEPETKQKSVLVIDDDPAIQDAVRKFLEHDTRVIIAPNVEMGLDMTRRHQPALVLLDIDLPVSSGMAYLRAMQQDERIRHTPIIMLTIYRRGVDVVQAMRAGAIGYVIKPIDAGTFPGYVRALLMHTDTTVLIADDDETISDLLAVKFRSLGVRVLQVKSGENIPEIIKKYQPQMLVIDWQLSGLDTSSPEKFLREKCKGDMPKCIVLASPHASQEKVLEKWPGADEWFSKPFTSAEVVTKCLKQLGLPGYEPMVSDHHHMPR